MKLYKITESFPKDHLSLSEQRIYSALSFLKSKVPHQSFIMALLYIDKACKHSKTLLINSQNVLRVAYSCIIIAAKFIDQEVMTKSQRKQQEITIRDTYLNLGIENLAQLKELEMQMFLLMDFKAFVSKEDYDNYQLKINQLCGLRLLKLSQSPRLRNS